MPPPRGGLRLPGALRRGPVAGDPFRGGGQGGQRASAPGCSLLGAALSALSRTAVVPDEAAEAHGHGRVAVVQRHHGHLLSGRPVRQAQAADVGLWEESGGWGGSACSLASDLGRLTGPRAAPGGMVLTPPRGSGPSSTRNAPSVPFVALDQAPLPPKLPSPAVLVGHTHNLLAQGWLQDFLWNQGLSLPGEASSLLDEAPICIRGPTLSPRAAPPCP